VRGDTHAGFGERPGETERQQCRHRAPDRLNHRTAHRVWPVPFGSSDRVTRYRHLSAAPSEGKCPRALIARRYLAFKDSIALVLHRTRLISVS
jgi:hypothetical protein